MNEENVILDFDAAINALNSASESFKVDVYIPSTQSTLTFKEIDAKQQKSLLSAAMDNSVYKSEFIKAFYDILKNNLINDDKSIIDNLNIVDKISIAISLRSQISNDISVNFTDNLSDKVKLNGIIEKISQYKSPSSENLEIKNENTTIVVNIGLPNLKTELEYEENFGKLHKNVDNLNNQKDLQNIISEAFIGEISKYINYIKLNETQFNFNTSTFNQKIKIVEKLPSGLIQKILEKVSGWKNEADSLLTVTSGEFTKTIAVDSLLFLN
jgi:hypothetical protein